RSSDLNVGILLQVLNAVRFAHSRGIIHRDVKPDNVMIGAFGEVYLLDWGIAVRPAETPGVVGPMVGTPRYLAPEMLDGALDDVGPHTDVYLLGATLHHILTGQPRHAGETLETVLAAAKESRPVHYAATVPAELAALCNAATAQDPKRRP